MLGLRMKGRLDVLQSRSAKQYQFQNAEVQHLDEMTGPADEADEKNGEEKKGGNEESEQMLTRLRELVG